MADTLRHPGPAEGPRLMLAPTRVERRRITLEAGVPLDRAIAQALAGADSAWISLDDAQGDLRFVLPDRARDGLHGAWYSAPRDLPGATIHRAGIVWGRREGRAFGHCHGSWGKTMGHLLLDASILSKPAKAQALVFPDARFEGEDDSETAFTLFKPRIRGTVAEPEAALLRLAPHVELAEGLGEALDRLGWDGARLAGLGSLNTAHFADGSVLDSHATEFLIFPGRIDRARIAVNLDIVGMGGMRGQGELASTGNRICVTAELILTRL
ncbi:hypothetical protein [Paracoccus marinaquae]|uniref:DUF296 domain-containing protein n=1 Tax=Paracoccus marinaquae TaxID=2841926 RepID=A0ABS6AH09_9RHOB|nr:hypothetical protein [Paracoccus marinaquae]MBU3029227.1 hypothetical protein [Paracoccus marinaquae]